MYSKTACKEPENETLPAASFRIANQSSSGHARAFKRMRMDISGKFADDLRAGLTDEEADALEKLLRKCAAGMRTAAD